MKRILLFIATATLLYSCKEKKDEKAFEVTGTITNNSAKTIYLEELPIATMQAIVIDSAAIDADGKFSLNADAREPTVFNLRLDKSTYPFAAVINDVKKITVNVSFNAGNKEFPEKYEITGSDASRQMKDFMYAFNGLLQNVFFKDKQLDSLSNAGAADSIFNKLQDEKFRIAEDARRLLDESIRKSNNPALTMFELGYYQTTANNSNYQLTPLDNDEVKKVVDDLAARFPQHSGVAAIRKTLQGLVGAEAPEIMMPDPNGKQVKLSSFRGKYVLVDFWASWCRPCRDENPNVVKAFNRFKDKNFTILGVSLDKPGDKDAWVKAIADDKLEWTQISDLMEWNSAAVPLYKIDGIPYNVLIDPSGKIIAEKLFGEDLEAKLAEVLK